MQAPALGAIPDYKVLLTADLCAQHAKARGDILMKGIQPLDLRMQNSAWLTDRPGQRIDLIMKMSVVMTMRKSTRSQQCIL